MLYSIQASEDTLLSEIGRSLKEDIRLKKTEERLCRHLAKEGMDERLHKAILKDAAGLIHDDTLVIIDPTDIQKPYAEKMPYLTKVWDGSEGEVGGNMGYAACMAVACESGCRKMLPLTLRLWSSAAPDFSSENDEIQQMIKCIALATNSRGIYVYDRGGDSEAMFSFYLENNLRFIVRLVGNRYLLDWGGKRKIIANDLAEQCCLKYEDSVLFKSHGQTANVRVQYGSLPVRLPSHPNERLHLVVVKWPGSEKRMQLLTTERAVRTRTALWDVVQGYVTRWRVEETIRYIKQSYRLEHMRLLDYQRLKNMAALVAAVAYFTAVWIGRQLKLSVLAKHVARVSKRMFDVPEFFYYALADGLGLLFTCHGRWRGIASEMKRPCILQTELDFETG